MNVENPQAQASNFTIDILWTTAEANAGPAQIPPELRILADNHPRDVREALVDADLEVNSAETTVESAKQSVAGAVRLEKSFHAMDVETAVLLGSPKPASRNPEDSQRVKDARAELAAAEAASAALQPVAERAGRVGALRERSVRVAAVITMAPGAILGLAIPTVGFAGLEHLAKQSGVEQPAPAPTPEPTPTLPPAPEGVTYELGPNNTLIVTTEVTEGQSTTARNPVAYNCEPTGGEKKADEAAVKNALDAVEALDGTIESAKVTGVADDSGGHDADAGLGKRNKGNECRADMREKIGVTVLEDQTAKRGMEIDDLQSTSEERILSQDKIAEIDRIAESLKMSRSEMLSQYNTNYAAFAKRIGADSKTLETLDDLLFRGAEFEFTVSREVQEVQAAPAPEKPKTIIEKANGLSIWIKTGMGALIALALGGSSAAVGIDRLQGRLARRRARREIAKLEKAHASGK